MQNVTVIKWQMCHILTGPFLINCVLAQDAGRFKEEIAPVPLKVKKEVVSYDVDEHPRPQTTLEGLKKLPSLFKENGLVHAGSASVSFKFDYKEKSGFLMNI